MEVDRPSFYLGSKEHRGEWQRPRAAYVTRVVPDRHGTQHLWLRIDPPVIRDDARGETEEIVIGPHFEGDVLWPHPRFPTAVYVYLPKGGDPSRPMVFDDADFDLVAWGEIYARPSDAADGAPS
jgi:hypothetical protein